MKYIARLLVVLLSVLYVSQICIPLFSKTSRGDLGLVLDAASRLASGGSVYDEGAYHTHTKPPLTTFTFVPLASLPTWWAERVWDCFLILSFVVFLRWTSRIFPKRSTKSPALLLFLSFACTFNSWNAELVFGQFNLLLMMAAMAAVYLPGAVGGAFFAFSLFFKPTQIVFVPWIWKWSQKARAFAGGVCGILLLALFYGICFGFERLIPDHLAWWAKAGGVTPMHVLRPDNLGLPSLATDFGMPASRWGLFQIAGFLIASWVASRVSDRYRAFAISAALTVIFSPMAWRYIYVLAFPLVLITWDDFFSERNRMQRIALGMGLFSYFWGTQVYNPELAKLSWLQWTFPSRPPLFGLLALLALPNCLMLFHFVSKYLHRLNAK